MQPQESQAAQINGIEVRTLVWRGGCQQLYASGRLIAGESDRSSNLRKLHYIPDGSVWKKLRSRRGELLCPGRIAAHRQRQGGPSQAAHRIAIARKRVGTRIGFAEFGGGVPESPPEGDFRGSPEQFVRLTAL